jgi:phosphoglucosamine mutase
MTSHQSPIANPGSAAKRRYFGTDGIRGRVGEGVISADFVLRLGNALGRVLGERTGRRPVVVIGKDTRISGYMFEAALEAGLVAAGADVQLMGPMPTPAVAFLTRTLGADAGIVISASHNPHYDNGIKFFSAEGEKLDDATEAAIEAALEADFSTVESDKLGKAIRSRDVVGRYIEFCKASVPRRFDLRGLKLVLDCAHGATYHIAPLLFRELGAEVITIGTEPDGLNINDGVGSMHIDSLSRKVRETGAHLGIAFDGDGDRVLMADDQGNAVDGDDLLYVLARDWQASGRLKGAVVGTLMTNYGLERALAALEIPFLRAKVGDRYVHQALVEGQGVLGGEASGHLLCLDRATTGDAIVSALQVLETLRRNGQSLREALAGLTKVPQKTINVRLASGARPAEAPSVQGALAAAQAAVSGRGRAFLRPSGTEPVVRVTVEADDDVLMQATLEKLAEAVRAAA